MSRKGRLFVISAPSGGGKGTIIKKLLELRPELVYSVSATTRLKRDGEIDGISYFFITRKQFTDMVNHGEFLEYAEYVGEYYGTPKSPVYSNLVKGKDVILEIEIQGAKQVMAAEPEAISVFIIPPDMDELERRLRNRGTDTEEKLAARLERARKELSEKDCYLHVVLNDEVDLAAERILSIIDNSV
jgi:guanylate kinase